MNFFKKIIFIFNLLTLVNYASAQSIDVSTRTNPLLQLGINTEILGLKGNVKEMQAHKFITDDQGRTINDSALVSNQYKFDSNGLTKEIEETFRNLLSKKSFFSYTNKGYVSHIDIETTLLSNEKDTTNTENTEEKDPIFSTVDYKYVPKKNILYRGEDLTERLPQKTTSKKEYFYHFNDTNQIFQIDYQTNDLVTQYNYDSNGLIKESLTSKSGIASYKNIYKYDRNNRLINLVTINSGNKSKYPNEETIITYKLDNNGNTIEKKTKTFQYTPQGIKKFIEGNLYLYKYTYL